MIGFRVDANEKIATGHLMRCIAIAVECRKRGERCLFLMAEENGAQYLEQNQFPYEVLHTKWDEMEEELPALCEIIKRERPAQFMGHSRGEPAESTERDCLDWMVVDSYQATGRYLSEINRLVPVMYIDDMAHLTYDVSALLHYGICPDLDEYRKRYDGSGIQILAGMEYTPLREEFSQKKDRKGCLSETSSGEGDAFCQPSVLCREKSILITTGGTDPYNVTGRLLELCLACGALEGYRYDVIVGSMYEQERELEEISLAHPQILLHKNVSNISDYMRRCRLAVSAGGTTLLELCACGIPTVCFSFADNQRAGTVEFGRRNVMKYAGDARDTDIASVILESLIQLAERPALRRDYALRMKELVDGRGVERIADVLCR